MKYIFRSLILLSLVLSACSSANEDSVSYPNPSYPNESYPNPEDTAMPNTGENPYAPSPADEALTRGNVYIDSVELLTLESYPLQFMLSIKGNLPTPCNQLRISAGQPDATNNRIDVEVYSVANPDRMCTQVLSPFEANYPLGSFPTGKYSIWVNGEMVAEFQS